MQNQLNSLQEAAPFGTHAPGKNTLLLRAITKIGLSRGKINRWISRKWQNLGYKLVDKKVRGVNYRLHITENSTDAKLLSSSKFYDGVEIKALGEAFNIAASPKKVFVDVGANTGYYSLEMARLGCAKVIAIEPNPRTLAILRYNIENNNFNEVIEVVPKCIGEGKPMKFYCSGGLGDASVFAQAHQSEPIIVDSASLLDIVKSHEFESIYAMKIDIEGYEDRALEPFFAKAPPALHPTILVIEICHQKLWQTDITPILKKHNYVLKQSTRANQIFVLRN